MRRQAYAGWRAVRRQVGEGEDEGSEEVAWWERCERSDVASVKSRRVVKWHGERFLVLFKSGGHSVSRRSHLFVSDVDQQWNKGAG